MLMFESCQEFTFLTQERSNRMRRKRYQRGRPTSPDPRASSCVGCLLAGEWLPSEQGVGALLADAEGRGGTDYVRHPPGHQQWRSSQITKPAYTFKLFINEVYLPFCRRSWKESTAGTSEQIVKSHLIPEFGKRSGSYI